MFYALWLAYALGTTAGTMVISQLVPFARASGFNAAERRVRDHHRRDRQRVRPIPVRLDVRSLRPAVHAARHHPAVDDRDAVAVSLARRSRCCSTCCCSSSTTATARSCRSTPRWPAISTARSISPPTTACCCWRGALPACSGRVIGSRVFVSTGTYQYAFFGSAVLACAALGLLSIVRPPAVAAGGQLTDDSSELQNSRTGRV